MPFAGPKGATMIDIDRICLRCMHPLDQPNGTCGYCGCNSAALVNEHDELPVRTLLRGNGYLIGRSLDRDDFGVTYIGYDLLRDRPVTVRELYPAGYAVRAEDKALSAGGDPAVFERARTKFREEFEALSQLQGEPSVTGVYDVFEENGTVYAVLRHVEGIRLHKLAAPQDGRFPSAAVLRWMRPVIEALGRIHDLGLLHCDISPDNFILPPGASTPVLTGFGYARQDFLEQTGSLGAGLKRGYAPIEQNDPLGTHGPQMDVYALCAVIYRLTTGQTPVPSTERITGTALVPPRKCGADLSRAEEQALLHGLEMYAPNRIDSMQSLLTELYGDSESAVAEPAQPAESGWTAPVNAAFPIPEAPSVDAEPGWPRSGSTQMPTGYTGAPDGDATRAVDGADMLASKSFGYTGGALQSVGDDDEGMDDVFSVHKPDKKKKRFQLGAGGKPKPLFWVCVAAGAVLLIAAALFIVVQTNVSKAYYAMRDADFVAADTCLDRSLIGNKLHPDAREYIDAGLLLSDGKYVEAAKAFKSLGDFENARDMQKLCLYNEGVRLFNAADYDGAIDVFTDLSGYRDADSLLSAVKTAKTKATYEDAVADYRNGDLDAAEKRFLDTEGYEQTAVYQALIKATRNVETPDDETAEILLDAIGFENAADLLMRNMDWGKYYLLGEFRDGSDKYVRFVKNDRGGHTCSYNLPNDDLYNSTFDVVDGEFIFIQAGTNKTRNIYRFEPIDRDSMNVYVYKDGKTYQLDRQ